MYCFFGVQLVRKERGTDAIDVPDSMKQTGARTLFKTALLRPFRFLFFEAIIIFGALYNGYLYGLSFLFNGAFSLVFGKEGHGFDTIGVGLHSLASWWASASDQSQIYGKSDITSAESRTLVAKMCQKHVYNWVE